MTVNAQPRGRYFEDFEVGEEIVTPSRTITNTDIVNFACLTGDFNEVHTNWEYCKTTSFGEPIAHGPLVYGVMAGLQYASGMNDGTLIALLQIDGWRMLSPIKHGDTIRMRVRVLEKKETSKHHTRHERPVFGRCLRRLPRGAVRQSDSHFAGH